MIKKKHQVCNQCVEMTNELAVEIKLNPFGSYMMAQKDGVKTLAKQFSEIFCETTGARFVEELKATGNVLILNFQVYPDTFALFEADYDRFIETVFGKIPVTVFGESKLRVYNYDQEMRRRKRQFIEMALGD
jgi:hypothetical protein